MGRTVSDDEYKYHTGKHFTLFTIIALNTALLVHINYKITLFLVAIIMFGSKGLLREQLGHRFIIKRINLQHTSSWYRSPPRTEVR